MITDIRKAAAGRLVLGTAAFGPYAGEPALEPIRIAALLETAREYGMTWIDTSPAYGEAELAIGRYLAPDVMSIATKVDCGLSPRAVEATVLRSAARMRCRPTLVQAHNATVDTFRPPQLDSWKRLQFIQAHGAFAALGATVYDPAAALAAMEHGARQLQVPYNLLDQRFRGVMAEATRRGVLVWGRSPWLRGALTDATPRSVPWPVVDAAGKALARVVGHRRRSSAAVALAFALGAPGAVIIGPRGIGELAEAVQAAAVPLTWWQRMLARTCATDDPAIVDPRTWGQRVNRLTPEPAA